MSHALIIDDNMVVSRAFRNRLTAFGYDSFDLTWTERQALEAAARHRPDLVVMGNHLASGSPLEVAREVASVNDAPILAVTADCSMFERFAPNGATIDGPHLLKELDAALASVQAVA
jgi:DNA-binding response OmpR family regulator